MRCKTCDYSLWALKTRQCPECGRPFLPSEFEFVPGSVRFACPFCNQSYYGTGANGHLIPREFDCVQCGKTVRMDDMVLFPAEGVEERQTSPEGQPWLERAERGRVGAWFRTIGMALVAPQRLMRLTPAESSVGAAWWFALVSQVLYGMVGLLPIVIFPLMMFASMRGGGGGGPGAVGMGGIFGGMYLGTCLGLMVAIGVWGLIAHAILLVTGGTQHSIGRTYQALCYGSGANVLMAVPCFGFHLGFSGISSIWWIVSAILMLKEGQRVHGGRATLAVLTFPVLIFVGMVTLMTIAIVTGSRAAASAQSTVAVSGFSQSVGAQQVSDALMAYSRQHNGALPVHAIELLRGNYLSDPDVLLLTDSEKRKSRVPVGDTTLDAFRDLPAEAQERAAKAAAAALPRNVAAHRLGDVVFTYHGITAGSADANLWLGVYYPDAGSGGDMSEQTVTAVLCNGAWQQFPASILPRRLAEQNRLRAKYRLPALPHPKDVTHGPVRTPAPEAEPVETLGGG